MIHISNVSQLFRPSGYGLLQKSGSVDQYYGKLLTRSSGQKLLTNPSRWAPEPVKWRKFPLQVSLGYPSVKSILKRTDLTDSERYELARFRFSLNMYSLIEKSPLIPCKELWNRALTEGPAFTDWLSDVWDYSLRRTFAIRYSIPPGQKTFELERYTQLFHYKALPFWEETVDDIKWCYQDTLENGEWLRPYIAQAIDEGFPKYEAPFDEEIFRTIGSSTSLVSGAKMPMWASSLADTHRYASRLEGQRAIVPVYPGGWRDTVILEREASNRIRWIERAIRSIVSTMPESAYHLSSWVTEKKIQQMTHENPKKYHIWRDIKKCGLTFNTRLLDIVCEEMYKRTGDERWNFSYRGLKIRDKETTYTAKRGYGLGMANAVATLVLICIFRASLDRLNLKGRQLRSISAIFGNDDALVSCNSISLAARIRKSWWKCEEYAGNLLNKKKSGIFSEPLFFEEYRHPGFQEKGTLAIAYLSRAAFMPSVRMAKDFIAPLSKEVAPYTHLLNMVIAQFPLEFYPEEVTMDYGVGGWLRMRRSLGRTTYLDAARLARQYGAEKVMRVMTFIDLISDTSPIADRENHTVTFRGEEVTVLKGNKYVPLFSDSSLERMGKRTTVRDRNPLKMYPRLWSIACHSAPKKLEIIRPGWYIIPPELVLSTTDRDTDDFDPLWELRPDQPVDEFIYMANSKFNSLEYRARPFIEERVNRFETWPVKDYVQPTVWPKDPSLFYSSPAGHVNVYQYFLDHGVWPTKLSVSKRCEETHFQRFANLTRLSSNPKNEEFWIPELDPRWVPQHPRVKANVEISPTPPPPVEEEVLSDEFILAEAQKILEHGKDYRVDTHECSTETEEPSGIVPELTPWEEGLLPCHFSVYSGECDDYDCPICVYGAEEVATLRERYPHVHPTWYIELGLGFILQ